MSYKIKKDGEWVTVANGSRMFVGTTAAIDAAIARGELKYPDLYADISDYGDYSKDIPFDDLTNVALQTPSKETFQLTQIGNQVILAFAHVGISQTATIEGDVTVISGLPRSMNGNRFGVFYAIEPKTMFLGYVDPFGALKLSYGNPGTFAAGNHIYGTLTYVTKD